MPGTAEERERDVERFLTFVDAIVAIAITLLVLPLVDVAGEVDRHTDVAEVLRDHSDQFIAFGISFWVIARLWFVQHGVLRPVVAANRALTGLLMVWLATIVVLPFNTALVARAGDEALVKGLYIGTILLSTLLMAALSSVVSRTPSLRGSGVPSDPVQGATAAVALAAALALALLVPGLSYWPLVLLYAADPLAQGWRRLRGQRPR